MTVLIAGGGISGLTLALSCHQVGIPFKVFEAVENLQPLGVGINLQPSAIRELFDLGFEDKLRAIGVPTRDYGMYTKKGLHIWTEPRGIDAGYHWPQYSVHRGHFHMLLYNELVARAGADTILNGWEASGFANNGETASLFVKNRAGEQREETGDIVIAADGIHSTLRAQIAPDEGDPVWGGAMLWRGTTKAVPFLTGASMVMIGYDGLRFVSYPISQPDPATGEAAINWIANLNYNPDDHWNKEDYTRKARIEDFLPRFKHFRFGWLDVPELVNKADRIYEYPMVDRDPLPQWTHGRVSLIGDAAHAAYPVGSNGAGSGIIDARVLVAKFLQYGLNRQALQAYEDQLRPPTTRMVLTNRTAGPDKILDVVEERCGGQFEQIEDVISHDELADHAATYKRIAGFGIKETNEKPRTIAEGAVFSR